MYVLAGKVIISQASWSPNIRSRVKASNLYSHKTLHNFSYESQHLDCNKNSWYRSAFILFACTYEVPTYTNVIIQVFRVRSAELQDAII